MLELETAIKAMGITGETVLFVDIDQIPVRTLEECESLPDGLLIVGVVGTPNVESMTEWEASIHTRPEEVVAESREELPRVREHERDAPEGVFKTVI